MTTTARPPRSMREALAREVVPALRARGFEGALPHLRRVAAEGTHTFTMQTWKWGGKFVIELGRVPPGPYTTASGEVVEPAALTSHRLRFVDRARLRAVPYAVEEVWFRYAPTFADRVRAALRRLVGRRIGRRPDPRVAGFERAAAAVLALLPECDQWWAGADGLAHVRSTVEQTRVQWEGASAVPRGPRAP